MPKRPRSHASVPSTLKSSSHAPQPPADTSRSWIERFRNLTSPAFGFAGGVYSPSPAFTIRSFRSNTARRYSFVNWIFEQTSAQRPQNVQRPMSSEATPSRIARQPEQGHASAAFASSPAVSEASSFGRPLNAGGNFGPVFVGKVPVRYPCLKRARMDLSIISGPLRNRKG